MILLFDLDKTLVDSSSIEHLRNKRQWADVYLAIEKGMVLPYDGIQRFLYENHTKHKLGIVTSSPRRYAEKIITKLGWASYFRCIVGYHDTQKNKPHPDPILLALKKLKVKKKKYKNAFYFGDQSNDIKAANSAGINSVACFWGGPKFNSDTFIELNHISDFFNSQPKNFITIKKVRVKYYALLKYYPVRVKVNKKNEALRELVFEFKKGRKIAVTLDFFQSEQNFFMPQNPNDWVLCFIPASNKTRNKLRFKKFSKAFSKKFNVQNGYSLIKPKKPRKQMKFQNNRNNFSVNDLFFDSSKIKGKKIILMDDVITSGTSFKTVAEELLTLGAKKVIGVFFSKTN